MHTNESSWKPEEILDTRNLQLFALRGFMKALGYEHTEWAGGSDYFWSDKYSNKGRFTISFRSAINLYNNHSVKCVFGKPPATLSIWSFDDYTIAKAKAAQILKSIKLQYCKQTKSILVQDHRVQFTIESYGRLFLNNKYL